MASRDRDLTVQELLAQLLPNYLLFAQCYFWACYGIYSGLPDTFRFNAVGAGMCVIYLFIIAKGPQEARRQLQYLVLAAVCFVPVLSAGIGTPHQAAPQGAQVFAWSAILCSLLQCVVPFVEVAGNARAVVSAPVCCTRAAAANAAASVSSSLLWAEYAVMAHSTLSVQANMACCVVAVIEVAIVVWGAHALRGIPELLLDADHRPLMPRAGGKKSVAIPFDVYGGANKNTFAGAEWASTLSGSMDRFMSGPGRVSCKSGVNRHWGGSSVPAEGDEVQLRTKVLGSLAAKSPFTPFQAVHEIDEPDCEACFEQLQDCEEPELEPCWREPASRRAPILLEQHTLSHRASHACRL